MTDYFGYTTTDYSDILTVEEREMQTLPLEALFDELLEGAE